VVTRARCGAGRLHGGSSGVGVDWYLDGEQPAAVTALRQEIEAYLSRHAGPGSDVDAATLVVSELLGNAVRHVEGPAWVSLTWTEERPVLRVADLGPGFSLPSRRARGGTALLDDPLTESGRGLLIVGALVEDLAVAAREHGGSLVTATLPVHRMPEPDLDPPRRRTGALPLPEEAQEAGFGREPFLRALVVQLAQAVEQQEGPTPAARAVAQVGTDVGGRMEEEYRAAAGVLDRLSPEQIAHAYVRLKDAIGGGFYVLEATERRIVLGNTRCPFGDVVRRAPSLCRMTSSVFGGIAARNAQSHATVLLEERIAVGDPGCRVVVELDPEGPIPDAAHRYAAPE
jgi:anti-sigma regulatory factor (Ser/Thr protein kinase)